MTAIVGVLNKHAVAIAADSAVTMGNTHKVINSGNKIFTLSKFQPVGIMTYSSADFMGTPWEIIIKLYRKSLRDEVKDNLEDYVSHFIKFVKSQSYLTEDKTQHLELYWQFQSYYDLCVGKAFKKAMTEGIRFDPSSEETFKLVKKTILELDVEIKSKRICKDFQDYTFKDFKTYSDKDLNRFYTDNRNQVKLPEAERPFFEEMFYDYLRAETAFSAFTGLVFTGYGDNDIFPVLVPIKISSFVDNRLKYFVEEDEICKIGVDANSCIAPFAQDDVINTIMGGMYPGFNEIIETVVRRSVMSYTSNIIKLIGTEVVNKPIVEKLSKVDYNAIINRMNDSINKTMYDNYTDQLLRTVNNLGIEDMANMAESFISLTSLIRRMSPHEETVGGPVDVAVISKGDGFIWINRKHYFKPEYNNHFFENYFRF